MRKLKSKSLFAIALLLLSGFVLGGTLLSKAIGANISFTIDGPASNLWWDPGANWDNHKAYSGVYIYASRIGNNGEIIGTLGVSGGRYPIFNEDEELTKHEYVACAYACGAKGRANAWVQVPGKGKAHDQGGPGDAPVINSCMDASDSCIRWAWGAGLRSMSGSAAHSAEGARVTIGFSASGI